MTTNIELTIDKSKWGEGPWQHERDRVQWQHAGYVCLAQRNPRFGFWCGYVGIEKDHPYFGKHYLMLEVVVHGANLTYSDTPNRNIRHVPEPGIPEDVWFLGFSCDHEGDWYPGILPREKMGVYRTVYYVKEQCESLANQLRNIQEHTPSEPEALARIIAVALGFYVDTLPDEVKCFTKTDCLKAANALLKTGWRKPSG